jgi:hypothetical protein
MWLEGDIIKEVQHSKARKPYCPRPYVHATFPPYHFHFMETNLRFERSGSNSMKTLGHSFSTTLILAAAFFLLLPVGAARAQEPAGAGTKSTKDLPESPRPKDSGVMGSSMKATGQVVGYLTNRSLFFPDIATSPGPLSTGGKFKLFVNQSISPAYIMTSGMSAGFGQWRNSPAAYGQGASGYFDRFGASMARGASGAFFGTFVLGSALHQDARFFPQSNPRIWSTVKYSVSRIVITRNDAGNEVFNSSYLGGQLMAESLANAYLPVSEQTVGKTFERVGTDIGWKIAGNIFKQYWPVMFKTLGLRSLKVVPDPNRSQP